MTIESKHKFENQLLIEYQVNVELWKHDDNLRQQRNANFLSVTTLLIIALSAFVGLKYPMIYLSIIALIFSLIGFFISMLWYRVLVRNAEYIRFRRFQLRSIEKRLKGLSTFTNTYDSFYKGFPLKFSEFDEEFVISKNAMKRSAITEGNLPVIISVFWSIIGFASIVLFFTKLV